MLLHLYTTSDGDNVINKTLTDQFTIEIVLKRDVDLINLELVLKTVTAGVDYKDFNYLHIPELGRYYFIRQIQSINADMYRLVCECDYIETYKTQILNSEAKYKRRIKSGDFGEIVPDFTGRETETIYKSNVTLSKSGKTILSTLRW